MKAAGIRAGRSAPTWPVSGGFSPSDWTQKEMGEKVSEIDESGSRSFPDSAREFLRSLLRETRLTSWELIRIMVPVILVTKVLEELGMITWLSFLLEPVMGLIGLPGSLGLAWATAMLTSIYGGMAVFAALAPGLNLTGAEVTILCSIMLIAHSLPVELSISKRAGAAMLPIAVLRIGGAVLYAVILNALCRFLNLWQEPARLLFRTAESDPGLGAWALNQVSNLGLIILVILSIIVCMRILRAIGVLSLLERILAPVLPVFGMGREAAPLTVVGMIMGISYGGALIIREASSGKMERAEIFNSMVLMGLCHALVEDTLLMMAIGGRLGGIFWGRILFSLGIVFCIVRLTRFLQQRKTRISTGPA
jgi:spore maturation protein SpmB